MNNLKLEQYFEKPVKLINQFGKEIIDLIREDFKSIAQITPNNIFSLEMLEKIEDVLLKNNNGYELESLFVDNTLDEREKNTTLYFELLLKEFVLLNVLETKKTTNIVEFMRNSSDNVDIKFFKRIDGKTFEKIDSGLLKVRSKIGENILSDSYSNSLLKKVLQLTSNSTDTLILFKAKLDDNQELLSIYYKNLDKLEETDKARSLDRELIINCLLGTSWSNGLVESHQTELENVEHRKNFTQFYFLELKERKVQEKVEKLLANYERRTKNLEGQNDEESLALNMLSIHVLRTVNDNVKNNSFLTMYVRNALHETINDVKLSANRLDMSEFGSNNQIIAWSYLLANLNIYKSVIYDKNTEDFNKIKKIETSQTALPQSSLKEMLEFISADFTQANDVRILQEYQSIITERLIDNLDSLQKGYGDNFIADLLLGYDCKMLPKFEILKEQWKMENEIPVNIVENNRALKF